MVCFVSSYLIRITKTINDKLLFFTIDDANNKIFGEITTNKTRHR